MNDSDWHAIFHAPCICIRICIRIRINRGVSLGPLKGNREISLLPLLGSKLMRFAGWRFETFVLLFWAIHMHKLMFSMRSSDLDRS